MEVTKANSAFMSNFEVMQVLKNLKDTKKKFSIRNLATITYETYQYLENSPCNLQTEDNIVSFLNAVKPFKLVKIENLLMINDPPTTPLEIQLIVEDSEERLSEDDVDQLLEVVASTLPVPEEEEPADEEAE